MEEVRFIIVVGEGVGGFEVVGVVEVVVALVVSESPPRTGVGGVESCDERSESRRRSYVG